MDNVEVTHEDDLTTGVELASVLGVTPSRVSQIIKKKGLSDKLIKDGNKKLIPKDVKDILVKYFSSTQQSKVGADGGTNLPLIEQLRSEIESLKKDKMDLRSDLDNERKTTTSLLASNYNLTAKLQELTTGEEGNVELNERDKTIKELNEALESAQSSLHDANEDLYKERSKSWWAKLTGK